MYLVFIEDVPLVEFMYLVFTEDVPLVEFMYLVFTEDVPLVGFMYLVFARVFVRVTVGNSTLRCVCVTSFGR